MTFIEQVEGDSSEQGSNYLNRLNQENLAKDIKESAKTEIIVEETSQSGRRRSDRFSCDCSGVGCTKCYKNQERNFNNNLSSNVNHNILGSSHMLSVNRVNVKNKLRQQSSGQSSMSNSPCLSRGKLELVCD